jgi:hypothetical protein
MKGGKDLGHKLRVRIYGKDSAKGFRVRIQGKH